MVVTHRVERRPVDAVDAATPKLNRWPSIDLPLPTVKVELRFARGIAAVFTERVCFTPTTGALRPIMVTLDVERAAILCVSSNYQRQIQRARAV